MRLNPQLYDEMHDGRYHQVIVESFIPTFNESTSALIRMRPVPGQGFPPEIRVECNRDMREVFPVGTRFMMTACLSTKHNKEVLYNHYSWDWKVV